VTDFASPVGITADHRTDGFDCGRPGLNDWLVRGALRNHLAGYTNVQVVADPEAVIRGYYGLAAASLMAESVPRAVRGGQAPDPVPALLIGRFAVDKPYQGRGLGERLFRHAVRRCLAASGLVGARVIVVHALDEFAARFYMRHGFIARTAEPLTLYQSIERVRAAAP
jgi:GNAT superfamily N-acetyltransferase